MFPIFHIALPLLIFEIPQIKNKYEVNRLALIIGSMFPDIIGKIFLFLKLDSGRGFSHSILFVSCCFLVLFFISKRNKSISVPFLIGCIFHLILDLPHVPLFYPFIYYEFPILEDPIEFWLEVLFTNPIVIITEIAGLIILLFIIINNKLYNTHSIIAFLKTNEKLQITEN